MSRTVGVLVMLGDRSSHGVEIDAGSFPEADTSNHRVLRKWFVENVQDLSTGRLWTFVEGSALRI